MNEFTAVVTAFVVGVSLIITLAMTGFSGAKDKCDTRFNTSHNNPCVIVAIPINEYEQIKQKYGVK